MGVLRVRNSTLEIKLQSILDQGSNVWVIGDVHGYFGTLEALVERLALGGNDAIVMLGDLIDRGPTSADIVNHVRTTSNIHSIRGNHEQMMIEGFDDALFFKDLNVEARIWYHNGGINTESSYIAKYGNDDDACDRASDDVEWMRQLPTEIVLNDWRLVHGGYDQNHDVEGQSESIHMHARKQFFTSGHAIDPIRTILFGHSVTFKHLHKDDSKAGEIWLSDIKLDDGRPMAIGLDTCVYHECHDSEGTTMLPRVLTAYNIQTEEAIYQNRIET